MFNNEFRVENAHRYKLSPRYAGQVEQKKNTSREDRPYDHELPRDPEYDMDRSFFQECPLTGIDLSKKPEDMDYAFVQLFDQETHTRADLAKYEAAGWTAVDRKLHPELGTISSNVRRVSDRVAREHAQKNNMSRYERTMDELNSYEEDFIIKGDLILMQRHKSYGEREEKYSNTKLKQVEKLIKPDHINNSYSKGRYIITASENKI